MSSIVCGDCRELLKTIPPCSVDSCVTDPPYEIGFMGKKWDRTGIAYNVELWAEVLRVLKPGGHLLAFAATRTYHRMACAIEDAGFEIRDQIGWLYGSGFPKSLDVSKAIDKKAGAKREVLGTAPDRWTGKGTALNFATDRPQSEIKITGSVATEEAKKWEGWGTALKPAWEPIVLARKPLAGTVAANVLQHGAGAINVDGCRVELNGDYKCQPNGRPSQTGLGDNYDPERANKPDTVGRWPANVIHDGSEEVIACFPDADGAQGAVTGNETRRASVYGKFASVAVSNPRGDTGSAARFFYSAKAAGDERDGNNHATVKPLALMRYLVRLITPPKGTVLDPFAGSGSTLIAAKQEGFKFYGFEIDPAHVAIINHRLGKELL